MRRLIETNLRLTILLIFFILVSFFSKGQEVQTDSTSNLNNTEELNPHVSSAQFNQGNVHQLGAALQGLQPGLWASVAGADPNLAYQLRVRGLTSVGNSAFERVGPTVTLLGFKGLGLADIDPFFIQQTSVINDGQLAKYGMQGALGAIALQPQQGEGKIQIRYHSFWSSESEIDNDPVLTARQFRRAANAFDEGNATDWRGEIGQNGQSLVNQLSVSGGNDHTDYYVGVSHRSVNGIQRNTGFDQTSGFFHVGSKLLNNRLQIRAVGLHSMADRDLGFASVYEYADRFNPTAPVRLRTGEYNEPLVYGYLNPVAIVDENTRTQEDTRSLGILQLDINLTKNLTWKNQVGGFLEEMDGRDQSNGLTRFREQFLSTVTDNKREIFSFQSRIQHDQQFGNLTLSTSAGLESQEFSQSNLINSQYTILSDTFFRKHEVRLMAYFAHVDFSKGDLSGQFSFRREGSSALSPSQQWNNYLSTTLRYNLSALKAFSKFEFFTSFGTSGMTPFQSAMSKRLVQVNDFPFHPIINQNDTDDLGQMSSSHFDLGINTVSQKGNWRAMINFFTNQTRDFWHWQYDDATLDFNTWTNTGELRTTGLEVISDVYVKLGSIDWTIRGVFSTQHTKIVDAGFFDGTRLSSPGFGCGSGTIHQIHSGDDFGNIYGPRFVAFRTLGDGSLFWEFEDDLNDQIIGNAMPDWTLGLQHQLDWKRFTLSMNFQGMFGHDVVNFRALHSGHIDHPFNARTSRLNSDLRYVDEFNRWSSYFVESGSFLRLQVITLRYQVPVRAPWLKDLQVYFAGNNLWTITGYDGNPDLQLTSNAYLDAPPGTWQNVNQWTPGIDRHNSWPQSKSVTFGVNASF